MSVSVMSKVRTIRAVLINGAAFERKAKGALVLLADRTDYERLDQTPRAKSNASPPTMPMVRR
jgi:hypothetical protein